MGENFVYLRNSFTFSSAYLPTKKLLGWKIPKLKSSLSMSQQSPSTSQVSTCQGNAWMKLLSGFPGVSFVPTCAPEIESANHWSKTRTFLSPALGSNIWTDTSSSAPWHCCPAQCLGRGLQHHLGYRCSTGHRACSSWTCGISTGWNTHTEAPGSCL